jgi:hypothetical protein
MEDTHDDGAVEKPLPAPKPEFVPTKPIPMPPEVTEEPADEPPLPPAWDTSEFDAAVAAFNETLDN